MKKLLIFTVLLGLVSCGEIQTKKLENLPIEVIDKQRNKQFDTVLVIKGKNEYHFFEKRTNNYINSTIVDNTLIILITAMGSAIIALLSIIK